MEFIEGTIEGREGREGEKEGERIKGLVTSSEEQGGKNTVCYNTQRTKR